MPDMQSSEGYLYIASGEKYIAEARISAKSLKKCNPDAHITLITDIAVDSAGFDEVRIHEKDREDPKGAKNFKAQHILHTPYDRTIFVDTDTYFIEDCKELFTLLDYHDMLLSHAPADMREVIIDGKPLEGYKCYNAGMIAYKKNEATIKLFEEWYRICRKLIYRGDQPPLMHALLTNPVKLYILHQNYNLRTPFMVSLPAFKAKILHGRNIDFEKAARIVNVNADVQRVWNPNNFKMIIRLPKKKLLREQKRKRRLRKKRIRRFRNKVFSIFRIKMKQ